MSQERLFDVRIDRNVRITMPDGVSLAADLHMPDAEGPFPTLVSMYPYHKDGRIGLMFENSRRYLARRGYASLLVDLRGTGGSSGIPWEVSDPNEHRDGAEVVEWAARQPWSDGNIGMWGGSYGGNMTLGTASLNPPHLKAICPLVTTNDLYQQGVYVGGCLSMAVCEAMPGAYMLAHNLMPPLNVDPEGQWYEVWVERLGKSLPYGFPWQDHRNYDEYWQSRHIPIENIKIPTFLVASWRDFFPEAMLLIYQKLSGPKRIIVGPWKHGTPDMPGAPEPVDYVFEMWRWWERWLKGNEDDAVDEPSMRIFVQGSNVWRYEREWPITRTDARTLFLSNDGALRNQAPSEEGSDRHRGIPSLGAEAGSWAILAAPLSRSLNQAGDDALSLTYTSDPLEEDVEITGTPEAVLHLALEGGEEANLVARLNDIGPDARSTNIATGQLKASHYRSHEQPERLQPGQVYEMTVRLAATSYLVPKGHRLRLSLSCADFPYIFPTATNPGIRVHFGGGRLSSVTVPVIPPATEPLPAPNIPRPETGIASGFSILPAPPVWKVERDFVAGTVSVISGISMAFTLPNGGTLRAEKGSKAVVNDSRPDSTRIESRYVADINVPTGQLIQVEATGLITEKTTLLTGKVRVDGHMFFEKQWVR